MTTNHWNTPVATLFMLAFSLSSFNSLAAESANFKIKGRFLPTTCNISLSQNEINLNDIKYGQLDKQKKGNRFMGRLWTKDVGVYKNAPKTELHIMCDSIASAGFIVTDNYNIDAPLNLLGTNVEGYDLSNAFGLKPLSGLKSNNKLGGYFFEMIDPKGSHFDDKPDSSEIKNVGIRDSRTSVLLWIKRHLVGDSTLSKYFSYHNSNTPVKAKNFSVGFKPNLFFYYDSSQRDMNDEITFEGSSTFTIFYI